MPAIPVGGKAPGSTLIKKVVEDVIGRRMKLGEPINPAANMKAKPVVGKTPVPKETTTAPKTVAKIPSVTKAPTVKKEPFVWTLEGDPTYQAALAAGQSKFNYSRAQSLADLQNQQTQTAQETEALNKNATEARRRLAGGYAARGMAGGAAGALTLAEAESNARQIAAQTSLKDQIAALNQQYLANYGATGTDWTGTLVGQQYKTEAAQAAINAQLAQRGVTQ